MTLLFFIPYFIAVVALVAVLAFALRIVRSILVLAGPRLVVEALGSLLDRAFRIYKPRLNLLRDSLFLVGQHLPLQSLLLVFD